MALWEDRAKLNLHGSDKLTLSDAERIIGARKPKADPAPDPVTEAKAAKPFDDNWKPGDPITNAGQCNVAHQHIIEIEAKKKALDEFRAKNPEWKPEAPKIREVVATVAEETHEEDPLPAIDGTAPGTAVIEDVVRMHDKKSILVIKQERFEILYVASSGL
jgi:hypothetical protein